jgi:hypothetical protein
MLDLLRPIYSKTAAYGHFGREEPEFTWERTDKVQVCARQRASDLFGRRCQFFFCHNEGARHVTSIDDQAPVIYRHVGALEWLRHAQ